MKEIAGLINTHLSPALAGAAELARALLAFRHSRASPALAAALHYRIHGARSTAPGAPTRRRSLRPQWPAP